MTKSSSHPGIAGSALLAFLLAQLSWPLSVSAQETFRTESTSQSAGLEELKAKLREAQDPSLSAPAITVAGMEEPTAQERARALIRYIRSETVERGTGMIDHSERELSNEIRDILSERLANMGEMSLSEAERSVNRLTNKLARLETGQKPPGF